MADSRPPLPPCEVQIASRSAQPADNTSEYQRWPRQFSSAGAPAASRLTGPRSTTDDTGLFSFSLW
jgi:hypothetical protein